MRKVLVDADVLSVFFSPHPKLDKRRMHKCKRLLELLNAADVVVYVSYLVLSEALPGLSKKNGVKKRAGLFVAQMEKVILTKEDQKKLIGIARRLHLEKKRTNTSAVDNSNTYLALKYDMELLYLDRCYEQHKEAFPALKLL